MAGREARHFRLWLPFPSLGSPAAMQRADAEAAAAALPHAAPEAAFRTGIALLAADYPELLIALARALADRYPADPRLAQLLGLAARAAGEGPSALAAFRRAAALAPRDALIAHSHARTALEAGETASPLFEAARLLAPADGAVIQGHAAALVAEHRAAEADAMLAALLAQNPLWIDGHSTLAQIRTQHGGDPLDSIDAALTAHPANPGLHHLRIATLLKARRLAQVPRAIDDAERLLGPQQVLHLHRAHALSELGLFEEADRAFAAAGAPGDGEAAALLARHQLKAQRPHDAAATIDGWLGQGADSALWPYAALAWRLTGDPRAEWLEGDAGLIGVYDLADRISDLPALVAHLRTLHTARAAPLDQSVRGGTQTDGNLLLRADPIIQSLRKVLLDTVAEHVARLPAMREGHPTLLARREPHRVAGSWSVRLQGAGFHTDHVHPQGWLSSAFYVAVPATQDTQGWLSLGACRDLVPQLAPRRLVEPRPGRLVLFPSFMWHGTRPFPAGERMTVAFDIARPKQD